MSHIRDFDPHEAAPTSIRELFKLFQKLPDELLEKHDEEVIDFRRGLKPEQQDAIHVAGTIPRHTLSTATACLTRESNVQSATTSMDVKVYEIDNLPGM